ncbi:MAG TPA: sulfatase-like hydrolase/transferase, partial [Actinopolymorphaceae bacterium]
MTSERSAERPNIVLVFMDDMGYGDMGAMGGTVVATPRMDSVAAKGVTFRHMYSAAPTCTPSR